ncbi:MAG: adenylate/guanylate cyclase domain-containing protein [Verrucomicrobia bacterium]|nr:adenylate/guanylate cyclase domain-containing protein [Verrucomicrobiota bacterium]
MHTVETNPHSPVAETYSEQQKSAFVKCIVFAQEYETYWAYYSQSDGVLYEPRCRQVAAQFVKSYRALIKVDPSVESRKILQTEPPLDLRKILQEMDAWSSQKTAPLFENPKQARVVMFMFMSTLKAHILQKLNLASSDYRFLMDTEEFEHSEGALRWKPHLPPEALQDVNVLIEEASASSTIAVVGDIRNSQDLMTYADSPKTFREKMTNFLQNTRDMLLQHAGVFDKFTGDGFLAYFNEKVCYKCNKNYIDCFLGFLKDERAFATTLFRDWSGSIRKHPSTPIGLAIGADIGMLKFEKISEHLIVVGEPLVWATRMASAAKADEILVNNMLFDALANRPNLSFLDRAERTKHGEEFLARILSFTHQ